MLEGGLLALATVTSVLPADDGTVGSGRMLDGIMCERTPLAECEDSPARDSAPDDYGSGEEVSLDELPRNSSLRAKVLAQYAIRLELSVGKVLPDPDRHRVRIGWIQIEPDERIAIRPCEDITLSDFDLLATTALRVRRDGPVPASLWRQLSGGLTTTVYAPLAERDQSSV